MNWGFLALCCLIVAGIVGSDDDDVGSRVFGAMIEIALVLWAMHWRF